MFLGHTREDLTLSKGYFTKLLPSFTTLPAGATPFLASPGPSLRFHMGCCSASLRLCGSVLCQGRGFGMMHHWLSLSSHSHTPGTLGSTLTSDHGKGSLSYRCHHSRPISHYSLKRHHNVVLRSVGFTPNTMVVTVDSTTIAVNSGKLLKFPQPFFPHL